MVNIPVPVLPGGSRPPGLSQTTDRPTGRSAGGPVGRRSAGPPAGRSAGRSAGGSGGAGAPPGARVRVCFRSPKRELKTANAELSSTGKTVRCSERRGDAWLALPGDVARHRSQGGGCFDVCLPTCMALGRQTGLSLPCFPCYILAWGACYLHARFGPSEE
jgi:hypothetical protein